MTDYFVIATGNSSPHLHALAEDTAIRLKKDGFRVSRREGTSDSGWIVLDYFNVVLHLMLGEARDYYSLENLWKDAPVIESDADGRLLTPVAPKVRAPRVRAVKSRPAKAEAAPAADLPKAKAAGAKAKARPRAAAKAKPKV